jgi:parallel beta-helix repeat protein
VLRVGLIVETLLLLNNVAIILSMAYTIEEIVIPPFRDHWLYVGGGGPGNFTRIQDAINNASDGDTIFVYHNRYQECICVAKQICLIGEDRNTTIIDGGMKGDVVLIFMSSVTVRNFTVINGFKDMMTHGIGVGGQPNISIFDIQIRECIIKNNYGGIRFNNVTDSAVTDCCIHNNTSCSITIYLSSENIDVNNCLIKDNGDDKQHLGGICIDGIYYQCSNIRITNCTLKNNSNEGISISRSQHIELCNNEIIENSDSGIVINGIAGPISDILVHNNTITKNGGSSSVFSAGIVISGCVNSVVVRNNNIVFNKRDGILLFKTSGNTLTKNNIIGNTRFKAFIYYTSFSLVPPCSVSNAWNENYWGIPQAPPKPIFGVVWITLTKSFRFPFPIINVDWHPAQEPYALP